MVVVGGESSQSDLNDFWLLDLERNLWEKPNVDGLSNFLPKRFHTLNKVGEFKLASFGGCHSDYVHLNDLVLFDLERFVRRSNSNISDETCPVICWKVENLKGVPSSRWGHSSVVTREEKLLIIGGRNETDVNDIHCFDPLSQTWHPIPIHEPLPNPRRRHSCVCISNCLVMFGGFDGDFYNDVNLLKLNSIDSAFHQQRKPTLTQDLCSLINNPAIHDISFKIQVSKDIPPTFSPGATLSTLGEFEVKACRATLLTKWVHSEWLERMTQDQEIFSESFQINLSVE
jgi:hypothetical protein